MALLEKIGAKEGYKKQRIKIGISTYNDSEYLDMLLQSIRWYTYIKEFFDIIVCDDGSKLEHLEATREVCKRYGVPLIEHGKNYGIPTAWNHLAESLDAKAEIVVLLNNDILVVPDWLRIVVHFLDTNAENSHVGSTFWNPVNRMPKAFMKAILPTLGSTLYETRSTVTGEDPDFLGGGPMEVKLGDGHGLGRVMCPCGCCFAFRADVFDEVGLFDERLTSFHEESDWGTRCASMGRASYGFAYPRPYHTHGAAFAANPELQPDVRMKASRALYRDIWDVPSEVGEHGYFKYVDDRLMSKIPKTVLKYLRPDYSKEPRKVELIGGEIIKMPELVEFEEEF